MNTSAGSMKQRVVDGHTHLGLEEFIVRPIAEEKRHLPAFQERMEHHVEHLLAEMDESGVAHAVSFPLPLEEIDPVAANSYVLDASRLHPERVVPFALLGDDVERWLKEGVRGFKQHPLLGPQRFHLEKIYPLVAEARVPVIAHLSTARGVSVADQVHTMLRMAPRLVVIVAHLGRRMPGTIDGVDGALRGLARERNVFFETSTVRDPEAIRLAVDIVGEDRVVFGSDSPFHVSTAADPMAEELKMARMAGLSERAETKVLGGNLIQLLGIEERG